MCLGMPGRVVEIVDVAQQHVRVDVDGQAQVVSAAMIGSEGADPVCVGDWVVVHLGFAMAKIDEEEARHLLVSLRELNDMYERQLSDQPPA